MRIAVLFVVGVTVPAAQDRLLVGPGPGDGWLIFEELSESRP